MKHSNSTDLQGPPQSGASQGLGSTFLEKLKSKRVSYLTLPLLVMATITEFVILATGWKYQQAVCLPQGMGVTFFGIGPIGATILAVELLKLPLAIWTASRTGWTKGFMLFVGLPLICVLTFQLVKDMAVYEMGTALKPATEMLEKASEEEIKISQLQGELAAIEGKKAERERKLTELAERKAKAKAELEEALQHNETLRQDAITLTDYQKKELSEVQSRQDAIIMQFNSDTAQLTKALADLRARREVEVGRATKWNAEDARIENDYKVKLAEYTNKKTAYEKDKEEYDNANFIKRKLMKEPVDPGVPPERETNTILKPTAVAQIDAQIKAKEAELAAVNNKRREAVAQVDTDARRLREEFDRRSGTKREEADLKREELLAAQAALAAQWKAEQEQIDEELAAAVQKVDGIRAEIDEGRQKAEDFYEAREATIRNTQVHRIATTVEIVRGLLFGERPMSITATAKERGDVLTDQISMVRIWVYPVLAFIVAFLPTLMVEIGFSTLFKTERARPAHRLGFLGRRLHWLYTRAGRLKILRFERMAREASAKLAIRDRALAAEKAASERALNEKQAELEAATASMASNAAKYEAQFRKKDEELAARLKSQEEEWVAKMGGMADSLNRALAEKDALRDFQKAEIERQVQLRQNSWSDRLTQLRQELDAQHAASEAERTALVQAHQKKLVEVSEECKAQVAQARRQVAAAELAAEERSAKLEYELKEAKDAREIAVAQLHQQTEAHALKLKQSQENAANELEKAARQEQHRLERQHLEFTKGLRQREGDFAKQLQQREEALSLQFDARLMEEQGKFEQKSRRQQEEFGRQLEARVHEVETHWKQELQQREDASQTRLKQRELQLQAQAEARAAEMQTKLEFQLQRQEAELGRQLEAQRREAAAHLDQELQKKELAFQAKLKQREQELNGRAAARENELQSQWALDLRAREEDMERKAESRMRAMEARIAQEAQGHEELFQSQSRQRDQQWQAKVQSLRTEMQRQMEQAVRRRDEEAEVAQRELEGRFRKEMQQKDESAQAAARQREQDLIAQINAEADAHQKAAQEWESELEVARGTIPAIKEVLVRAEKERDEARRMAAEGALKIQDLEKKLMGASSLLSGWKSGNGKPMVGAAD